jgi:hypothetical protein
VAADGGTFEAEACLQATLDKFNSIPWAYLTTHHY